MKSWERKLAGAYLLGAVAVAVVIVAGVADGLYQWNYHAYSEWASPLLWDVWLPCSGVFLLGCVLRKRWTLVSSPAIFLTFACFLIAAGPLMISAETALSGKQQGMEILDYFECVFGLCYATLNIWLLRKCSIRG